MQQVVFIYRGSPEEVCLYSHDGTSQYCKSDEFDRRNPVLCSDQQTYILCLQEQGSRLSDCLAYGHMTVYYIQTSKQSKRLFKCLLHLLNDCINKHLLNGNMRKLLWALLSLFTITCYSNCLDFSFGSVQQMYTVNHCSVAQME